MDSPGLQLITCIVQRGKADQVMDAAVRAGAHGATVYFARGTGVRQKLGFLGRFIQAEKEVILIVVRENEAKKVFDAVVQAGKLDQPGQGFGFLQKVEAAVGFIDL